MKKLVIKSEIEDERSKRRVLKMVAGVQGVDSVSVDMKEKKITVIGEVDPVFLTAKLRKFGSTELLSVGPAKEEKKEGEKLQSDAKNKEKLPSVVYYPSSSEFRRFEYTVDSEENPNACVIF